MATQVYFIGAGPGDIELLTVKAVQIIRRADVIIYADSLINPEIRALAKEGAEIHRSASLSLEEITTIISGAVYYKTTVNLDKADSRIRPDMTVNALIETAVHENSLVAPVGALQSTGGKTFVQVLAGIVLIPVSG